MMKDIDSSGHHAKKTDKLFKHLMQTDPNRISHIRLYDVQMLTTDKPNEEFNLCRATIPELPQELRRL